MSQTTSRRRPGRTGLYLAAGLSVVGIGLVAWLALGGQAASTGTRSAPDIFTVPRGDLSIRVVENATLAAAKSVDIKSELEGNHTVIYLAAEGARVKAGDKLVELDASDLVERRSSQEIAYEKARADYESAEQNYHITKNQNDSDTQAALNKVLYAELDLEKFLGKPKEDGTREMGEEQQEVRAAQAEIQLAEEELKRAEEKLEWSIKLEAKKFVTKTEREADVLAVNKRKIDLELAGNRLHLLKMYTHVKTLKERHAIVDETKAELERVKLRCVAVLVQEDASRKAKKSTMDLETERFEKLKDQIKKAVILAPRPGLVVYATLGDGGRGRGRPQMIEEGMQVRERQTIIILPDTGSMIAMASVHESQVDKVREGQRAMVKVDAAGGESFPARVSRVAILPDSSQSFMSAETKVYRTEITLDGDTTTLRPGMSASVEVMVSDLKDVTYVPLHAVQRSGKTHYVWLASAPEPTVRKVVVGLHNDRFIHVTDGLEPGERVLLSVPSVQAPTFEGSQEDDKKGAPAGDVPAVVAPPLAAVPGDQPKLPAADPVVPENGGRSRGMGADAPGAGEDEAGGQRRRNAGAPGSGGPGSGGGGAAFTAFREKVKAKFPDLAEKIAGRGPGAGLMDPDVRAAIDSDEELKAEMAKLTAGMRGRGQRPGGGGPGGGGPGGGGPGGGGPAERNGASDAGTGGARPEGTRDR